MSKVQHKTAVLMPYAPLKVELDIGGIKFIPFQKLKVNPKIDKAVLDHLTKIVATYKNLGGSQIHNPTFIFVNNINFKNPTRASIERIETAKNLLAFLGIMRMVSFSFVTSDNFEVIYQSFVLGDDHVSTRAGSIHSIMTGGYQLPKVTFYKPEYINLPFDIGTDNNTLSAFNKELFTNPPRDEFLRILRSLEFFFDAYRNSYDVTWYSRILLIFIALEVILDCETRPQFRNRLQDLCTHKRFVGKEKTYSYPIMNTQTGIKMNDENLTYKQIWAEEFYKLRHNIIHHGVIPKDWLVFKDLLGITKRTIGHFYIAERFYISVVLQTLRRLGYTNIPDETIIEDPKEILKRENNYLYNAPTTKLNP